MGLKRTVFLYGIFCITGITYPFILGVSNSKLSKQSSTIHIYNDTKKTCQVVIEFKFVGPNTLKQKHFDEKGYILGTIRVINITPRSTAIIDAFDAVYKKNRKVIDNMKKVYDIAIMKISIGAERNMFYSQEKYPHGSHATSFIIHNDGNKYRLDTSNCIGDQVR